MYKAENIQRANYNGRAVKIFDAYELVENSWIFVGQFSAPARTANKNLVNFIQQH